MWYVLDKAGDEIEAFQYEKFESEKKALARIEEAIEENEVDLDEYPSFLLAKVIKRVTPHKHKVEFTIEDVRE